MEGKLRKNWSILSSRKSLNFLFHFPYLFIYFPKKLIYSSVFWLKVRISDLSITFQQTPIQKYCLLWLFDFHSFVFSSNPSVFSFFWLLLVYRWESLSWFFIYCRKSFRFHEKVSEISMNKRTIWGIANDWRRWTLKSKALNLILEIFTMEISFQFFSSSLLAVQMKSFWKILTLSAANNNRKVLKFKWNMKNFSCWAPKWNEEAALISFKIENASTRKMARVVVKKVTCSNPTATR